MPEWLTHLIAFGVGVLAATYLRDVLGDVFAVVRDWAFSILCAVGVIAVIVVPGLHYGWFT